MPGRHGLRNGHRVRDLDGKDLGRVARLYDGAFLVVKGFPILFRRELVIRYDEIRGLRDGELVVARSDRALFELAAGELPEVWRIPAPPGFPEAATPPEARGVFEALAGERTQAAARIQAAADAPATVLHEPETPSSPEDREASERPGAPGAAPAHVP
jgi:hypothetical protein